MGESEIRRVIAAEHRRTGGPVCVVASSMGAFAAAALIQDHRATEFLLVSPLASSPSDFVARARRAGVPARERSLTQLGGKRQREIAMPEDEAYLDYFGHAGTQSLGDRLSAAASLSNWGILYSARDIAIGQGALEQIRAKFPGHKVQSVSGGGHAVEDPFNFAAYQDSIDAFLQRCLARRDGRAG